MSRASISTGNISLNTTPDTQGRKTGNAGNQGSPLHIALIGDFSGRASRSVNAANDIASRKAIEIDRDNFEEVFSQLHVTLDLAICDTPIHFREFDDLHPDFLVEHVPLFDQFRQLTRRLNQPAHFQQAADEIAQWQKKPPAHSERNDEHQENHGVPLPDNMLDAVLAQSASSSPRRATSNDIDQLIKSIVAPYAQAKLDPRLPDLLQAVDDASAHTLRKVLHTPYYQQLEANWRSLYLLIRRIETNRSLKLFLFDISPEELIDDAINHQQAEDSQLYQLLHAQTQVPGATPYQLVQTQLCIEDDIDHLRLASHLANIAQANHGISLAAGSTALAGCESIAEQAEPQSWKSSLDQNTQNTWDTLRNSQAGEHLALTAPGFLVRLPYGKKSSPITCFDFEELGETDDHTRLCWASGASLVTLLLAENYRQHGAMTHPEAHHAIEDLPLYIDYRNGSTEATPCAEVFMTDSCANALNQQGLLALRSVKGQNAVHIPRLRTVAMSGKTILQTNDN